MKRALWIVLVGGLLALLATPALAADGPSARDIEAAVERYLENAKYDADLIGGARIPQVILPGFAGPYTAPPDLPDNFTPNASTGRAARTPLSIIDRPTIPSISAKTGL